MGSLQKQMDEAPEAVRSAHTNTLRAWIDIGSLEYGQALGNTYSWHRGIEWTR